LSYLGIGNGVAGFQATIALRPERLGSSPGGEVLAMASTVWLTVPRPVPAPAAERAS
jgi:hypothetical protein